MTASSKEFPMESDLHEVENRFAYHPATGRTAPVHAEVRLRFAELARWITTFSSSRERNLALTELQTAMMWMNAHIAYRLSNETGAPAKVN